MVFHNFKLILLLMELQVVAEAIQLGLVEMVEMVEMAKTEEMEGLEEMGVGVEQAAAMADVEVMEDEFKSS